MRLTTEFFERNVLEVAPDLLGKYIARQHGGVVTLHRIVETEAYCGEEDLACHASKGRTPRTEVMYGRGGLVYVYLIYGMYHLLNFVTAGEGNPQAALIRGVEGAIGPGRVGKLLQLDKSFYAEDLVTSTRIWVEDKNEPAPQIQTGKRIGVDYAGSWKNKPWRFMAAAKNLQPLCGAL
ncbi:MAG: DNA-3-methyladenine glycosylase [Prevotellaceae bacterium]|jgi:DNA-3-methyladenine glycosylase|nr:DNA-3-methyladenine glycosylase [Prevotellaceae bacterium]